MAEDKELRIIFERYEKLLFKAANDVKSETLYSFVKGFSKKVDAAVATFKQIAKSYIDKAIPTVNMSAAAAATLRRAGAFHETPNVKLTTYVQMVSKLTNAAEQFKGNIQSRIDEDEKKGVTTTVTDLREHIKDALRRGDPTKFEYENGTKMPVEKYAAMLARTTRTETQNISMLGKALDDGNDLVECSTIYPTCPTCARLQGRIYSISGNTPGYPALYDTAFRHGYSVIHPNCRHQFFPYKPKFHSAEENERLQRDTRRPWDDENAGGISAKDLEDYRDQYAKTQMQMRRWNKELNEYAKYKEFYGERKETPTYSTLGSFRRAYRSEEGSAPYARTHYIKRDTKQFEEFKKVLGAENMPETVEKFQEMKYNREAKFEQLVREKTTIKEIKGKEWTDTFKQKAIDTYYDFRKSGIELTDHGVARLLSRFADKKEELKEVCKSKPFNYLQDDGKRIKHYDKVAIVYVSDSDEVVSFIDMKKPKKGWRKYDKSGV